MHRVTRAGFTVAVAALVVGALSACASGSSFEYATSKAEAKSLITAGMLPEQLPDNARDIRVLHTSAVHVATWHGDTIVDPSCVPADAQPPKGNRVVIESQTIRDVYECTFGFQGRDGGSIYWWPAR